MIHTAELLDLLRFIAGGESAGSAINCEGRFPDRVIRQAERAGLISVSIGGWADDGQFCSLRNPGRAAIGLPALPTLWTRLMALRFWKPRSAN